MALRALVRAGFEVSYQPKLDVTMISSGREATPATVVLMQNLRTHYDDTVAEMLQDDDTSGTKLMYGLGTWRRPEPQGVATAATAASSSSTAAAVELGAWSAPSVATLLRRCNTVTCPEPRGPLAAAVSKQLSSVVNL